MMKAANSWYVIRTKPGTQRMASARPNQPERRLGESIIERNLRDAKIDVFMPSYWIETKHHRKNTIIERRMPLIVGYVFANLPEQNFEEVRDVEGVMCLLKIKNAIGDAGLLRMRDSDMEMLAFWEHRERQEYLSNRWLRVETERKKRLDKIRTDIKRMMPKGRSVRVSMINQAEQVKQKLNGAARERLSHLLAEFHSLTDEEASLEAA